MAERIVVLTFLIISDLVSNCEGFRASDVPFELLLDEPSSIGDKELKESVMADLRRYLKNDDPVQQAKDTELDFNSLSYVAPETKLCKDKFKKSNYCLRRRLAYKCWGHDRREHSIRWCANTCGYCNCRNWKYRCCPDIETRADGPHHKGCPKKLCYDAWVSTCIKVKNQGTCNAKKIYQEKCPWSCEGCYKPSPSDRCKGPYGCCWDGRPARAPNMEGCQECRDIYPITCSRWGERFCNIGAYHTRRFMEKSCPATCGRCSDCFNRLGEARCRKKVLFQGCKYNGVKQECAKYCDLCKKTLIEADTDMDLPWK